ncbi:hypothetical protein KL905_001651 [Ogataea polymorpha]|uniref:Ada DNA repair metal-binding domain-containing protein n=1 Tax=Ogataea polymorpha TaxID=460523 RepID=A0A9P8P347_9ASCO|nr:hypothetical protein KL906_004968 [Ogataea polymorpha]KAG7921179.1 hypothetical protein KL927_000423 [Ogataea polymorpha]KAG7922430.1 hypothetical protein KL905_001651 [Ogataea polymorpha]KAH3664958.1 hypothetical protein OGATHE_003773 [Ogataea polymorpha]
MYSSEQSKWVAFQFKDPFAADKFLVCHVGRGVCCRPNCDLGFSSFNKSDIVFVDTLDQATANGYHPCKHCFPDRQPNPEDLHDTFVSIDLDLLVKTVEHVNESIGFIKPLMDEENDKNSSLKESLWKSNNTSLKKRLSGGPVDDSDEVPLTRNKFDHLKLIDLACRHIALAALSTSHSASMVSESLSKSPSPPDSRRASQAGQGRKKRRRGGVLGFKELASKSNLSPWHFHRVFKSVTGQTPKAYGDKCWEFVNKQERKHPVVHRRRESIVIDTRIANPTLSGDDDDKSARGSTPEADREPVQHAPNAEPAEPMGLMETVEPAPPLAPLAPTASTTAPAVEPEQLFKPDLSLSAPADLNSPLEATTPLFYDPGQITVPPSAAVSPIMPSTADSSATSFQWFDEIEDLFPPKAADLNFELESYHYTPSMAYITNQQAQLQKQRQLEETELADDWLSGFRDDHQDFLVRDELTNYIG